MGFEAKKIITLLLAGGTGSRMGEDVPKQYIEVRGRMVIDYCMKRLLSCERMSGIWVVAHEAWREQVQGACGDSGALLGFSDPGETRAASIENGIRDLCDHCGQDAENTIVIIHDAARPLVSAELLDRCIDACGSHEGAMPVLPMTDTIYYGSADGSRVEQLLDRDRLFAGQAPEVYRLVPYKNAIEALSPEQRGKLRGTTEPAVMAGLDICMVPGDEKNFKITTRADLERFRELVAQGWYDE